MPDPTPNAAGLFSLCGKLDLEADDVDGIPCCGLPLGHEEPHAYGAHALTRWKIAHGWLAAGVTS